MHYDFLLNEASKEGIFIDESISLTEELKGLYIDGNIALSKHLNTTNEKKCILAEELGHYHTSYGDITDLSIASNRKQELVARAWAYNKLINLNDLISAYIQGCQSRYDIASYLEVTEEFLLDFLEYLKCKHGTHIEVGKYTIFLDPELGIFKKLQ